MRLRTLLIVAGAPLALTLACNSLIGIDGDYQVGDVPGSGAAGTGGAGTGGGTGANGGSGSGAAGTGASGGTSGGCDGMDEARGGPEQHCYWRDPTDRDWATAKTECESWGGTLASVTSVEEYGFLLVTFQPDDFWIGLYDPNPLDGTIELEWINGEPYPNGTWNEIGQRPPWRDMSPKVDEDCTKMHDGFESKLCDHMKDFLCEKP